MQYKKLQPCTSHIGVRFGAEEYENEVSKYSPGFNILNDIAVNVDSPKE